MLLVSGVPGTNSLPVARQPSSLNPAPQKTIRNKKTDITNSKTLKKIT
jgi:hypothetical protein